MDGVEIREEDNFNQTGFQEWDTMHKNTTCVKSPSEDSTVILEEPGKPVNKSEENQYLYFGWIWWNCPQVNHFSFPLTDKYKENRETLRPT